MTGLLEQKVAIITGGSRGLGLAIAEAYAREGAAVVVGARNAESVNTAVTTLKNAGLSATGLACDVGKLDDVQALADHARAVFGGIDIWVNNAGVAGVYGPTLRIPAERALQVIQTNIIGTYNGSTVAMRHFTAKGHGKLINLLGRGDHKPVPFQNAYGPSKSWVRSFTLALAEEYQDSGVGVYAFNPGLVLTELLTDVDVVPGYEQRVAPLNTVIRLWANKPEVPAREAVWLASAATDGRTGLAIDVLTRRRLIGGIFRNAFQRLRGQTMNTPIVTPRAIQ